MRFPPLMMTPVRLHKGHPNDLIAVTWLKAISPNTGIQGMGDRVSTCDLWGDIFQPITSLKGLRFIRKVRYKSLDIKNFTRGKNKLNNKKYKKPLQDRY